MMRRDLVPNVVLNLVVYLLPCAFAPERLAHPSPWVAVALGCILLFTQPKLDSKEMVDKTAKDRFSALGIYVGMSVPQIVAALSYALRRDALSPADPMVLGGSALAIAALAFRVWSIRTLGRFFTSTVRVAEGQTVVNTGPYRLLRHPSYTGALGTAIGTTLLLGSIAGMILVVVLAIPAYLHRMKVEEQALARDLGEPYREYMRRTKRLVPFVY